MNTEVQQGWDKNPLVSFHSNASCCLSPWALLGGNPTVPITSLVMSVCLVSVFVNIKTPNCICKQTPAHHIHSTLSGPVCFWKHTFPPPSPPSGEELIYLDPHTTQPAVEPCEDSQVPDETYHCQHPPCRMHICELDPSIAAVGMAGRDFKL